MYRVFNMGMGMIVICSPHQVSKLTTALPQAKLIGGAIKAKDKKKVVID